MQSKDDGSPTARIVIVGEAYGRWEDEYQRPFVGPSWNDKMVPWLAAVGLTRADCWITNCWDQGMPARIDSIPEYDMRAAMERCRQRIDALPGPDGNGPIVIVPMGNYALYTFTGNGRVSFHSRDGRHDRPGIYDWRGSILSYQTNDGRTIKVIPTVHPANTFPTRTPGMEWVCRKDWERIAEDAKFRELKLPVYSKIIAPSKGEAIEWMRWTRSEAAKVAHLPKFAGRLVCSADVETPYKTEYATIHEASKSLAPTVKCKECGHTRRWHQYGGKREGIATANDAAMQSDSDALAQRTDAVSACAGLRGKGGCDCKTFSAPMNKPRKKKVSEDAYMGCNGYAWRPDLAICLPTTLEFWQNPEIYALVRSEMAAFHADTNIDFGGQNFSFDAWWYAKEGMPLHHIAWDTMKMHRTQRPWSQWHDLGFQASIDTRIPYWKHEAKSPQEISRWSSNKEALWSYNCTDNHAQLTLLCTRIEALAGRGRLEYHELMEAPIDNELLPMSLHGIRADVQGRAAEHEKLLSEATALSAELNATAGMNLVAMSKKGVITGKTPSNAKLKAFLYEKHRLPMQYQKAAKGRGKTVSVNVVAIRRCMEAFPGNEELQVVGRAVIRHRRLTKRASELKDERVEADGRVYCHFKQDTLLGRLSASSTPMDEGQNLQQADHENRRFYIADVGDEVPH